MTKTRERLLNRAKKENLSQGKIDFLLKEDFFPEYFYECSFHFLVSTSDEELEACGYKLLEDLFLLSGNQKIFRNNMRIFYHNYPCGKVVELLPYIKENYLLPKDGCFFVYKACNWDLEETLHIFELAKNEGDVNLYLNYINIFDKKGNPYLISIEERHSFAHYFTEKRLQEEKENPYYSSYYKYKDIIEQCFKSNISFKMAQSIQFDLNKFHQTLFEKKFPNLNQYIQDKMTYNSNTERYFYHPDPENKMEEIKNYIQAASFDIICQIPYENYTLSVKRINNSIKLIINTYKYISGKKKQFIVYDDNLETVEDKVTEINVSPDGQKTKKEILIYFSEEQISFYQIYRNKCIPLSLQQVFLLNRLDNLGNILLQDLILNGNMIFKDFLRNPINFDIKVPPILMNECIGKQNLNQYFYKYKNGHYFSWNKGDYQKYYVIMKSLDRVNEKDKYKLIDCKNHIEDFKESDFLNENHFLTAYILHHIKEPVDFHEMTSIHDYIDMCKSNHHKVKINFHSIAKIIREHDLEITSLNLKGNTLKIPKNSIYKPLRKMLPKEFEWIKNKKRLITEGQIQKHCVAGYADKIKKDHCAIYSIIYNKIRYTLEFIYKKQEEIYYLNQCQSSFSYIGSENFDDSVLDYIEKQHKNIRVKRVCK